MSVWTINEAISAIDQKGYQTEKITHEEANQSIATILQRSKNILKIVYKPLKLKEKVEGYVLHVVSMDPAPIGYFLTAIKEHR